jgi:hypothetical protein
MAKRESDFPLKENEWRELLKLAMDYQKQADACYRAEARVASCVMIVAGVEAMLIVVANLFCEDAKKFLAGKKHSKMKDLLYWDFDQLLRVAEEAKWLPAELTIRPDMDCREIRPPVTTDTIRQVRNFVHPGRFVRQRPGEEISLAELAIQYGTCHAAYSCLQKKSKLCFQTYRRYKVRIGTRPLARDKFDSLILVR